MYNKIVNPNTGRKVNINNKLGRKILSYYLYLQSGGFPTDNEEKKYRTEPIISILEKLNLKDMTIEPWGLIGPEAAVFRTIKIPMLGSEDGGYEEKKLRIIIQTNDMQGKLYNEKLSPEDLIITSVVNARRDPEDSPENPRPATGEGTFTKFVRDFINALPEKTVYVANPTEYWAKIYDVQIIDSRLIKVSIKSNDKFKTKHYSKFAPYSK